MGSWSGDRILHVEGICIDLFFVQDLWECQHLAPSGRKENISSPGESNEFSAGILGAGGGSGGSANQLQNRPLPHPNDNKVRSETEGASLTGMSVVPGFCNGFHGALRPGYTQAWDFIADAANPNKMATTVKPCAAIRVRIMSWDRWLWPRWKQ